MINKLFFTVILAFFVTTCVSAYKDDNKVVTGVTLDMTEQTLIAVNEECPLTAIIEPAGATNRSVEWKLENVMPAGAVELTTGDNGMATVKAKANGKAVVTVTTADGGFTASCKITAEILYPSAEEELSPDFTVKVDGKKIFVYRARVSAYPENQIWPGYQRPLDQTELASFCYFDAGKTVNVEIESKKKIEQLVIRPLSKNIRPVADGNKIKFALTEPCQLVIEVNDRHQALHLFANAAEKNPVNESGNDVIYFGPGIHRPGIIELRDNQTLYVAGGAVVHALVRARNVKNVTIRGRGILDGSTFERGDGNIIKIENSENITVEGVILRDPPEWTLTMFNSQNIETDNVKLIGLWRYNADGIDVVNSNHVTVKNSFVRAFDDCIALKGYIPINSVQKNIHDVHIDHCVIWNDWGRAFEIGAETMTDSIYRCSFRNSDVIHFVYIALDIQNGNRAHVYDVEYENIRIEDPITDHYFLGAPDSPEKPKLPPGVLGKPVMIYVYQETFWSQDEKIGKVSDILFRNIHFTFSGDAAPVALIGYDAEHDVSGITFDNVTINGKKLLNVSDGNIQVNDYVKNLKFK